MNLRARFVKAYQDQLRFFEDSGNEEAAQIARRNASALDYFDPSDANYVVKTFPIGYGFSPDETHYRGSLEGAVSAARNKVREEDLPLTGYEVLARVDGREILIPDLLLEEVISGLHSETA